ncbi:hypothetical protein FPZ12_029510 [Amycolatopsis acidicola]|uniref:Uncharacterized protein n=1 Tax=Amycolatopsis acidicola TaxID=2596893 RepID=A0A5N0UV15_9PSEU|nr:hypothetical protein [Amycolatopsis acidicola]KAA9155535.1 hypothetical protein FPZ12_029510 [Amycolatopsis acidicola]
MISLVGGTTGINVEADGSVSYDAVEKALTDQGFTRYKIDRTERGSTTALRVIIFLPIEAIADGVIPKVDAPDTLRRLAAALEQLVDGP